MIALWRVDNGALIMERETRDFPKDDFPEAVRMLRDNLSDETRKLAVQTIQQRVVKPEPVGATAESSESVISCH